MSKQHVLTSRYIPHLSSSHVTKFTLQIEVYEVGTTEMRSDTAMVHIYIIDINDNPPMFEFNSYTISVREEQSAGAFVGRVEV